MDTLPDITLGDPPLIQIDPRLGQVLNGRYRLEVLLGTGGAGAVYAALDLEKNREVAVKILHDALRTSEVQEARFLREARATARVGHPGVVSILDIGRCDDDGCLFMVMELLRGEQLWHALSMRRLDDADVLEIGRQLLEALAAAHRCGIVHRDVKPENVFLTWDASGELHVKLIDFGIAKYLRPDLARSTFSTLEGMILGTPNYMSPEACLGQAVDESTDLWSVAATLFYAFAGEPPFDAAQVGRLLMRIVSGHAPSLRRFRPGLPKVVIDTIDVALLRNRELRWQTADAFIQRLDRCADALS